MPIMRHGQAGGRATAPTIDAHALDALYELFGECRFGFREALTQWSGNATARAELSRATLGMIEREPWADGECGTRARSSAAQPGGLRRRPGPMGRLQLTTIAS